MSEFKKLKIGVLALQGDFSRHFYQLSLVGANPREIKLPAQLNEIDALIIPGGESTTMSIMIDRFSLHAPLKEFIKSKPVWGTCAGVIMIAENIEQNQSGVVPLNVIPISVIRNGYGRQLFSFETTLRANLSLNGIASGQEEEISATFIRAPKITKTGDNVELLAEYKGDPVLVRYNNILASTFHTELGDNTALLEYFLKRFCLGSL